MFLFLMYLALGPSFDLSCVHNPSDSPLNWILAPTLSPDDCLG